MTNLADELQALTDQLEKLLHETLPEAARALSLASDSETIAAVRVVVSRLDAVERALGLKTFELLRRGPVGAIGPVLAGLSYVPGPSPVAPPGTPPPPVEPADTTLRCSYLNCPETTVKTCFLCSLVYCSRHIDAAVHPCAGDLLPPPTEGEKP